MQKLLVVHFNSFVLFLFNNTVHVSKLLFQVGRRVSICHLAIVDLRSRIEATACLVRLNYMMIFLQVYILVFTPEKLATSTLLLC